MSIGNQISQARSKKGWTQQQLAEAAGISLRTVQRIENDQVKAQFHTIHQLEDILQVAILDADENQEEVIRLIRTMGVCILLVFVPIVGNIIIPFFILRFKAKNKRTKQLGGAMLMFEIIWTVGWLISEIVIFNVAEMIWGESNPGDFSPVIMIFTLFWLINFLFVLTILFQSVKGNFKLLERLPSIY